MALRVQGGKVDAQGLGHFVVLDDDQVLAREVLDRHILGLGLALQDLDGHLAGGVAQIVVADGQGRHAAAGADALLTGEDGLLGGAADAVHDAGVGGDGVVGGDIQGVVLAKLL